MSLLDTASLIVTPNGYKEGKLYSVIPSDGSGDLSVTRATTATRVNSAGLVELVPYNLFTYSQDFSNAAWTKDANRGSFATNATAPDGTTTAQTLTAGTDNYGYFYRSLSTSVGNSYAFSFYAKKGSSNFAWFEMTGSSPSYVNLTTLAVSAASGVTATATNVGNDWVRIVGVASASATSHSFAIGGSNASGNQIFTSGNTVIFWGAQLVEGSTAKDYQKTETRLNIPRLDYSNGTCPSLLVEPQRTNYFPYSQNIANWYEPDDGVTLTSNTIDTVSPDGTNNASKITIVGGNQRSYQITNSVSGTGTFSAYVKAGTSSTLTLYTSSASVLIGYNLSTLAVTQTIGTGTITSVGNGWYRITATNTLGANEVLQVLYTGNANETIYIWGFQVEAGSYATSYIPTTSASVTRNADVISKTGISSLIGQTEGTIFWDIYVDTPSATGHEDIFNIDNGSFGNTIYLFKASNATFTCEMYVSGSGQASFTKTGVTAGRHKIAFAYANNNTAMFFDGVQVGSTDTSCSVPTMSRIQLGQGALGPSTGFTNAAALWQTRLDNATLAQLTTI
jgi:hypothetical protein